MAKNETKRQNENKEEEVKLFEEEIKKAIGEEKRADEDNFESFEEEIKKALSMEPENEAKKPHSIPELKNYAYEEEEIEHESIDDLLEMLKRFEPKEPIQNSQNQEIEKEESLEDLLEMLKRFEPKESTDNHPKREVNTESIDKKAVKRRVNAIVNNAIKTAKKIKKEEKNSNKEEKISYKKLVKMAKNIDTSDFEEIPSIEELLEIIKRFEPKEPVNNPEKRVENGHKEKKVEEVDKRAVRRNVNAMVNDAMKTPRRLKKAEKRQEKRSYRKLVKMAKNMDLSDFEEIQSEPIEHNTPKKVKDIYFADGIKKPELISVEMEPTTKDYEDGQEKQNENWDELLKRFETPKHTRVYNNESKEDIAKKSELKAEKLIDKLNRLYEKIKEKPPRTFLGRIFTLAKIEYMEETVKERKEANIVMTDKLKKEENEFVESYSVIEQKLWEKEQELEIKGRVLKQLEDEQERRLNDYNEGLLNESELNRFDKGSLNQALGFYGLDVADIKDEIDSLREQSMEIRNEFEKKKNEINKKYGESLSKDVAMPVINLLTRTFKIGFREIARVGSNVANSIKNIFKKHEENKEIRQENFTQKIEDKRLKFREKYLFTPEVDNIKKIEKNEVVFPKRNLEGR